MNFCFWRWFVRSRVSSTAVLIDFLRKCLLKIQVKNHFLLIFHTRKIRCSSPSCSKNPCFSQFLDFCLSSLPPGAFDEVWRRIHAMFWNVWCFEFSKFRPAEYLRLSFFQRILSALPRQIAAVEWGPDRLDCRAMFAFCFLSYQPEKYGCETNSKT